MRGRDSQEAMRQDPFLRADDMLGLDLRSSGDGRVIINHINSALPVAPI